MHGTSVVDRAGQKEPTPQAIFVEVSEQYMPMGQSISAVDPTEQCEPVERVEGVRVKV